MISKSKLLVRKAVRSGSFGQPQVQRAYRIYMKKAATRLYFLKQLKRAKVPPNDMLLFYTTCIRPVLEYPCPVFHHSLPQYQSNEMERLQKRTLRITQPDLSYAEALVALDITSLYERRKALSNVLFDQIVRDESHKLHDLLPPRNESTYCIMANSYNSFSSLIINILELILLLLLRSSRAREARAAEHHG